MISPNFGRLYKAFFATAQAFQSNLSLELSHTDRVEDDSDWQIQLSQCDKCIVSNFLSISKKYVIRLTVIFSAGRSSSDRAHLGVLLVFGNRHSLIIIALENVHNIIPSPPTYWVAFWGFEAGLWCENGSDKAVNATHPVSHHDLVRSEVRIRLRSNNTL